MKYHGAPCFDCQEDKDLNSLKPEEVEAIRLFAAELRDDLLMNLVCPHGHKSALIILQRKFEVLFDLGAMSMTDGYSREAVSSFAAAVERLYEYAIRVMLIKANVSREAFLATWKHASNQSERQLGAFAFLYLMTFREPPPMIHNDRVSFRNKAIHKGYIPSHDEALDYGKYVYGYIIEIVAKLKATLSEEMSAVENEDLGEMHTEARKFGRSVTLAIGTVLNVDGEFSPDAFEPQMQRLMGCRWLRP